MAKSLCSKDDIARILFVDDDPIIREFARVNLASASTEIDLAQDGLQAVEMLSARPYALIVTDLEMPRLDGFALLERLRGQDDTRHLPIVVATGREDVLAIDRAFSAGATSFVVKPLHWRLLAHQLRFILRSARGEAQLREMLTRAGPDSPVRPD